MEFQIDSVFFCICLTCSIGRTQSQQVPHFNGIFKLYILNSISMLQIIYASYLTISKMLSLMTFMTFIYDQFSEKENEFSTLTEYS